MLGLITIGQTPRPDLEQAFRQHAGDVQIRLLGALDELTPAEVRNLRDPGDTYPLLVRLSDGTSCEVPMAVLVPLVAKGAASLAAAGASLVVVLCAGGFPGFECRVPVLLPGRLVPAVVAALLGSGRVGVVVPVERQVEPARRKWCADGFDPVVTWAAPDDHGELARAAAEMSEPSLEIVVLDCMGHDDEARRAFARGCGRPVVAAQPLTARVAGALIKPDVS